MKPKRTKQQKPVKTAPAKSSSRAAAPAPAAEPPASPRLALHVGGVIIQDLPPEAWPSPSPVELAQVAAACGWRDQPERAMGYLWQCAQVIHESRQSAARFVQDVAARETAGGQDLAAACGFPYHELPEKISREEFLRCFRVSGRLRVNGREMRNWEIVNHWLSLPEGMAMSEGDLAAWHERHRAGFDCKAFSAAGARWEFLALLVVRFNEWRAGIARANNPGAKNLRRGDK